MTHDHSDEILSDDDWMASMILERVGSIARGETTPDELTGSTTIRLAVGLIVGNLAATNPSFPDCSKSAWEMLDRPQRRAVKLANASFQSPEWDAIPLPYP